MVLGVLFICNDRGIDHAGTVSFAHTGENLTFYKAHFR